MDIFFQDPAEIPLPPEEVRIRALTAEPWPDGQRVRINLEVDPFQKRPSAEVIIFDTQGNPVAQTSIIESMTRKMEFNMHLKQARPGEAYTLQVILFYQAEVTPPQENEPIRLPESKQVDRREISIEIKSSLT